MRVRSKVQGAAAINTLGLELPEAWLSGVGLIKYLLTAAASNIKKSFKDLRDIDEAKLEAHVPTPIADGIREAALRAHRLAEERIPFSVCPNCKMVPEVRSACPACDQQGWVTLSGFTSAPKALVDMTDPFVTYQGKQIQLSAFPSAPKLAVPKEAEPAPKRKKRGAASEEPEGGDAELWKNADLVIPTDAEYEPDVMQGDPVDGTTPADDSNATPPDNGAPDDWGFLP